MSDETNDRMPQPQQEEPQAPPRYEHYQVNQPRMQQRPPERKASRRRQENNFGKKAAVTIALAVIFGLVAGLVFQGVNMVADRAAGRQAAIGTTEIISGNAEADAESGSSVQATIAQNGSVAGVAQASMPSVVAITSVSIQEIPSVFGYFGYGRGYQQYQSAGSGSGIIVGENDEELLIATNNHVVADATTLSVCFIGNDVVNAEEETQNLASGDGDINVEDAVSANIKGTDAGNDLAVVAVNKKDIPDDTLREIKIAQLGNSDNLVVGEQVVAIGNALGYGQSVTSGWISALNRSFTMDDGSSADLIQTDAAINPGNSGGALLNMSGEVIGINSAKYADNAVEGMGYAIPISKAQPILENLMKGKVSGSKASYLGVKVENLTTDAIRMYNMPAGAFVVGVIPGEAAEKAGFQEGDIIQKLDGQIVNGKEDLVNKLMYYEAGEEVEIVIARANDGEYVEHTVTVTLGTAPEAE